jgi:S1-C subfamily serine protease
MKIILTFLLLLLCLRTAISAQEPKPTATPATGGGGGGAAVESAFRLIGSVSGTKLLEQSGRLSLEDPRTVFYSPADKEIIVYFTWEGPPGPHRFEGVWKNPSGKVAMTSEFEYKPEQRRFGGYFKMLTGDAPATGVWTLEARIDGETAGSHTFQITTAERPEGVTNAPTRRMLNPSEIYNRAAAASVFIENINAKGARRSVGTGFFIGPGKLLTAFQVIDGAARVRVIGPQGRTVEATEVLSYNRRQDWILLKVPIDNMPALERVSTASWSIGDRNYFLDVPADGNRVLVDTTIIGKQNLGVVGHRINIGDTLDRRGVGSPLINDFGEVIGMIGGSLIPGAAFNEVLAFGEGSINLGGVSRGTVAIPIELINDTPNATTVDGLLKAGQFIPALATTPSVLDGRLARTMNKKTDPPQVIDEKVEFSPAMSDAVVLVTWLPKEKRKGYPALRVYDIDNQLINETLNKKKITVNPNKLSYSLWELKFATLKPGIYRIDVLLDSDFVWRTFFRMVE